MELVEGRRWVRPLCWIAVLLDGFDLVVLGTITPVLLSGKVFGYTPTRPPWSLPSGWSG